MYRILDIYQVFGILDDSADTLIYMHSHQENRISPAAAGRDAVDLVRAAFMAAGWEISDAQPGPDLLLSKGAFKYAAQIKAIPRGSSVPIEDAWSRVCLEARSAAEGDALALAIIVAPKASRAAVERLAEFARRHAPDVAMGVIDHLGLRQFRGPGLDDLAHEPNERPGARSPQPLVQKNLFSDLNQWLLKVLLAPELPEQLLSGPRGEYRNAYELAEAAGCSVMSAHRFIEELRREGFVDEGARRLQLVRRAELFRRWKQVPAHSLPEVPYRMLIPMDVRSNLERLFGARRACLGLFAAADELGVGFVSGVAPHVLVDRQSVLPGGAEAAEGAQNLVIAERGDAVDLVVRIPKAVRSVFLGSVQPKQVASADIIQVWLDVSEHPSRGAEQAEVIWGRYLAPLVERSDDA